MPLTFHLVPHTHWDREWYLARAGFEARLAPLIDDALALLERDPELRFHLDGQTVLVEDYLALADAAGTRAAARERLRRLAASGRLGIGPWYVLADEQIPSGESLLRNLLLGLEDSRALGADPAVLYSPDAFGHPAILPTIGRQAGLRVGLLWRGLGPPLATGDLVRWRGPDGAALLVHHLPRAGYELGSDLVGRSADLADRWARIRAELVERARSSEILVPVGADHHAPDPELPRLRERIQRLEPDSRVRFSSLAEFFRAVEATRPAVPEIAGELRAFSPHTWSLQGVAGTRARQKRLFGAAELLLQRIAEPLGALAAAAGGSGHVPVLRMAWRRLIQSQFHDSIAGTVADPVAREQTARLESVRAGAIEVARSSLAELVGHDFDRAREEPDRARPALLLWNPAARERGGIVTAAVTAFRGDVLVGPPTGRRPRTGTGHQPFHLGDRDGVVPVQLLAVRQDTERVDAPRHYPDLDLVDRVFVAFQARPVGGLSTALLEPSSGAAPLRPPARAWRRSGAVGNERISLRIDRGSVELCDQEHDVTIADLLEIGADADDGDTYTASIRPGTYRPATPMKLEPLADGPLVSGIAWRWRIGTATGPIDGRTAIAVHADSSVVRLRIDFDTRATGQRIRARFRVGGAGAALAGTPFGQARREPVRFLPRDYPTEWPARTAAAQRFVALPRGERQGFLLVAPGPFEYEWTDAGDLFVTLCRSIGELSKGDLPERPGHAGWAMPVPDAQEPGRHRIELGFSVIDRATFDSPAALLRAWEDTFLPIQTIWHRSYLGGSSPIASIELIGDELSFEALKAAEDGSGLVLRALDRSGRGGSARWRFGRRVARAERIRGDETGGDPLPTSDDRREVEFGYRPAELVTIRVRFEDA